MKDKLAITFGNGFYNVDFEGCGVHARLYSCNSKSKTLEHAAMFVPIYKKYGFNVEIDDRTEQRIVTIKIRTLSDDDKQTYSIKDDGGPFMESNRPTAYAAFHEANARAEGYASINIKTKVLFDGREVEQAEVDIMTDIHRLSQDPKSFEQTSSEQEIRISVSRLAKKHGLSVQESKLAIELLCDHKRGRRLTKSDRWHLDRIYSKLSALSIRRIRQLAVQELANA